MSAPDSLPASLLVCLPLRSATWQRPNGGSFISALTSADFDEDLGNGLVLCRFSDNLPVSLVEGVITAVNSHETLKAENKALTERVASLEASLRCLGNAAMACGAFDLMTARARAVLAKDLKS